ncbi:MAG: hypothetical protein QCI82_05905 [Candidatus Thermoplasmatota archaeon]|nr:hypothetical protein [Candidatus Thermoplasmatota archaeon]
MSHMEERIVRVLRERGELTTSEIEEMLRGDSIECPDGAVKSLMRLKGKGEVEGRIDRERRGWVWKVREQA